ncbi:MAG: copper chaperone PCu(A)C [Pseudomonadota bacterium]
MTKRILGSLALALVLGATYVLYKPALAHDFEHGDLKVVHPVARPSMGAAANSAVYMTIENVGAADRLVGVSSDVAERVELHTTVLEDGVLKMQELEEGIVVPASDNATLETGGNHVMLMGLDEPLRVDDKFMLTLEFEEAGPVDVEVYVVHPDELGEAMHMESHD